mgnify:FL=1
MKQETIEKLKQMLDPKRDADKAWYLALLDEEGQLCYEKEHLDAVLRMLRFYYLSRLQRRVREIEGEMEGLRAREGYSAGEYRELLEKQAEKQEVEKKIDSYKCYFVEPYFARIDVVDDKEGYNSYYIGKKGDVNLEIVDWRAPLAVRYYQKSRVSFTINEYEYRTVLRRALSVKNGRILSFRNEYLSVRDHLTPEEIAGRDEEILFDPYLRSILKDRKDDFTVRDIIETIQEKQFEIITRPERESFVLQGCAGSGKTMILLHRLSYLMYNNESLRPRDVLVITPSDSFNAFIDELSKVLELQKVRTITLRNYYLQVLKNEGIELRCSGGAESREYLAWLYSDAFPKELEKDIGKLYGDIFGLFTGRECRSVAEEVFASCKRRHELYVRVKNASVRIRRTVLGEMKENKEGGFYFTKPMRGLMSSLSQVQDFLSFVLTEGERTPDYFFRQFAEFYRCAKDFSAHANAVFSRAEDDLASLKESIEKEIADLRRYRQKGPDGEYYSYADRIAAREELFAEADRIADVIGEMKEGVDLFGEFFAVIRLFGACAELGKCEGTLDVSRWLYRHTVKKYKKRFALAGVYPSDAYALCSALSRAGRNLTPRYGLVFIDEGQDISPSEYALLRAIHSDAAFNVFGDLKQNITPWRGLTQWEPFENYFELDVNYRNTNEIVSFVAGELGVKMQPIGMTGAEVERIPLKRVSAWFRGKQGLKAVIVREEDLPLFEKRGFGRLSAQGASKTRINVMTVFESKGLEFSAVAVLDRGMTENEKYIAYTRALRELAVIDC